MSAQVLLRVLAAMRTLRTDSGRSKASQDVSGIQACRSLRSARWNHGLRPRTFLPRPLLDPVCDERPLARR